MSLILAFLLGLLSGLRTFTPLAVVSGFAALGAADLSDTAFAWLGSLWAFVPLALLAVLEVAGDKRSDAPPRTGAPALAARLVAGLIIGAAAGSLADAAWAGAALGALGAFMGAQGGRRLRARLSGPLGSDKTAGMVEDLVVGVAALGLAAAL